MRDFRNEKIKNSKFIAQLFLTKIVKQFKDISIKCFNIYTWQYSRCVIISVTTGICADAILKDRFLVQTFVKTNFCLGRKVPRIDNFDRSNKTRTLRRQRWRRQLHSEGKRRGAANLTSKVGITSTKARKLRQRQRSFSS